LEGGACRSQEEEVDWAIEKEKEIGYNFLIPVILDEKAWNEIEIEELKNRIYLKLNGFTTSDIKSFADELNDKLFKWLINSKKNESNYEEKPLYNMELKLIPGNILHSSALTSYEGENHLIFVTLKINEKGNTDKNTIDGIPCFQLTMSNLGADLEIEDVQMVFKEPQERPQDPIKNGKVNPDSIISVKINNNNIRIKGNHTELLSISDRLSFELILRRGIDTIVAIDVMKNEYKVDKHEIEAAMRYVNYFYSIDGFVDFYDEFINRNQN